MTRGTWDPSAPVTVAAVVAAAVVALVLGEALRRRLAARRYRYPHERELPEPRHGWMAFALALCWAGLVWAHLSRPVLLVVLLAATVPLLVLAAIDQDVHRLPDRLQKPFYPLLALGLLVPAFVEQDWSAYGRAVIGAVVGLVVYFLLALAGQGGLGLGDVKLAGILGMLCAWFGWRELAFGLVAGFFVGALWGLQLVLRGKATRKDFIPLGPSLIVGALGVLVLS